MTETWTLAEIAIAFLAAFVVCAALIEAGMHLWTKWRNGK